MADNTAPKKTKSVFKDVYFAVIPSDDLQDDEIQDVIRVLETNGASHCPLSSSELRNVTHLISKTSDFPAYQDAIDAFIYVVTPRWISQSVLKGKASNPRPFSPDPKYFLANTIITVADDVPQGDRNAIIGGIAAMGGQYSGPLTKLCTHVLSLSTDSKWCKIVLENRLPCVMVLPHWFDHCMKLGRKLDTTPYELPDPPLLKDLGKPVGEASAHPDLDGCHKMAHDPPESPSKHRKALDVLRNKRVFISADLGISDHMKQNVERMTLASKGSVATQISEADILLCQYREGDEFRFALENGLEVANLNWFYWVVGKNSWTSPLRRLLHCPYPKDGLPDFKDGVFTVSNYTGDSRAFLENLVIAAGGTFTKTLTQENTHLITAHTQSDKCDAAREWGLHVVNHLWLEESYAACRALSTSHVRYTTFPSRTNLGEIVGQTSIDRATLLKVYTSTSKATELPDSDDDDEAMSSPAEDMPPTTSATTLERPSPPRSSSVLTPSKSKLNEQSTGRTARTAKNRALNKLHKMAPDIALFEKESRRVGGVVYGGRRATDADRVALDPPTSARKRASPPDDRTPKKQKTTPTPAHTTLRVLCTQVDSHLTPAQLTKLRNTPGIKLLDAVPRSAAHGVDVLVCPEAVRTRKFLAGLAQAPAVVRPSWVEQVLRSKGVDAATDDHEITTYVDLRGTEHPLGPALARARAWRARGGLLKDWTVFVAAGVKGGANDAPYAELVERNGGKCAVYSGAGAAPRKKHRVRAVVEDDGFDPAMTQEESDDDDDEEQQVADAEMIAPDAQQCLFLLADRGVARDLVGRFERMAADGGYVAVLVDAEWLIQVCCAQSLRVWDPEWRVELQ